MRAGKLQVSGVAAAGGLALAVAALAGGCSHAASSSSLAPGQTPPPITPTMTPSAVPVVGKLTLGTFPATWGGANALQLCEDWAGLRAQYVARVRTETSLELEQWFSSDTWQPAFNASGPLATNPGYGEISLAFGAATTGTSASIAAARLLDKACAAAD